jgi:nickel-dependent lactate racemase
VGHERAANGVLEGNPLHEEQMEIVEMAGGAYSVNAVINEDRALAFVNFGEIGASHLAAVDFVREHIEVPVERKFHTVLTSAAGYPLDRTYYQTVKGMVAAMDILRPGGNVFVASECSEGLGSLEYRAAQERLVAMNGEAFLAELRARPRADIDEWQTQMQLRPMEIGRLHLYSEKLSAEDHALTGVSQVHSLSEALRRSVESSGDRSLAVIPEGPYVMPKYVGP